MLFKRMELILGMKSDLRKSRWPAGNPAMEEIAMPPRKQNFPRQIGFIPAGESYLSC
jgi:hypothetical protein